MTDIVSDRVKSKRIYDAINHILIIFFRRFSILDIKYNVLKERGGEKLNVLYRKST